MGSFGSDFSRFGFCCAGARDIAVGSCFCGLEGDTVPVRARTHAPPRHWVVVGATVDSSPTNVRGSVVQMMRIARGWCAVYANSATLDFVLDHSDEPSTPGKTAEWPELPPHNLHDRHDRGHRLRALSYCTLHPHPESEPVLRAEAVHRTLAHRAPRSQAGPASTAADKACHAPRLHVANLTYLTTRDAAPEGVVLGLSPHNIRCSSRRSSLSRSLARSARYPRF
ncbi:hypothetical protein BD414DRAFT_46131 [Trametes punicea]|nr:hypothetical protein BD414DRAFT_46131 [Trametes punicea]